MPIGIILLMGIVKNNALMLADFALEAEHVRGLPPEGAIREACLARFRPTTMTTLSALLGALQPALALCSGSEFRVPLGIPIAGGLMASQALTTRPPSSTWPWTASRIGGPWRAGRPAVPAVMPYPCRPGQGRTGREAPPSVCSPASAAAAASHCRPDGKEKQPGTPENVLFSLSPGAAGMPCRTPDPLLPSGTSQGGRPRSIWKRHPRDASSACMPTSHTSKASKMHKDKKAPGRAVAPPPNPAFMRMLIPAGIIPVLYTSGVLLMHGFAPGALESWLAFSHAATMLPGGVCSSLSYVESTMVAGGFAERVALVQNIAASQILASAVFLLAFAVVFALAFRRSRPWFAAKADEASNALFPEAGHENWSLALLFAVVIWLVCAGFSAYPVLSLLDGSAITNAPFAAYRSDLNLFLFSAMMAGLPFSVAGMATFSPVVIAFARRAAHARRPVG